MKKLLTLMGMMLIVTALSVEADVYKSFTYDVAVQGASSATLQFGRTPYTTNGYDSEADVVARGGSQYDMQLPTGAPVVAGTEVMTRFYFLGTDDASGDGQKFGEGTQEEGSAISGQLADDFRNANEKASTWTLIVQSIAQEDTVSLNWEQTTGETPASNQLQLCDESGNVLIQDMTITTQYDFAVGTYLIKYNEGNSLDAAPEKPKDIELPISMYAGKSFSVQLLDTAKYVLVGDPKVVWGNTGTRGGNANLISYDPETGVLTYTASEEIPADRNEIQIYYNFKNVGASEDAGTAEGIVRAVITTDTNVSYTKVNGQTVNVSDAPYKVKVDYTDDTKVAYASFTAILRAERTVTSDVPFTVYMKAPAGYQYTVGTNSGTTDDSFAAFKEVATGTFTEAQSTTDFNVTITPNVNAKGGDVVFQVRHQVTVDEQVTNVVAPEDDQLDITTMKVTLAGDGNLDVNNDGVYDLNDLIVINYKFIYDEDFEPEYVRYMLDDDAETSSAIYDRIIGLDERLDVNDDDLCDLNDLIVINYKFIYDEDFEPEQVRYMLDDDEETSSAIYDRIVDITPELN